MKSTADALIDSLAKRAAHDQKLYIRFVLDIRKILTQEQWKQIRAIEDQVKQECKACRPGQP